jgi:hypothetical protein
LSQPWLEALEERVNPTGPLVTGSIFMPTGALGALPVGATGSVAFNTEPGSIRSTAGPGNQAAC